MRETEADKKHKSSEPDGSDIFNAEAAPAAVSDRGNREDTNLQADSERPVKDRKRKVVYLMEYPIDLPGGGQMSTRTLCEGIIAAEMIRSEKRPDRRDPRIMPKRTICEQIGAE